MIITNCPRCGSMNATATCTKCGWSQFTKSTVSTKTIGEIEIKVSGKALLDDYKRLLLENRNLKERVAELEAAQRWIPVSERLPEVDQEVLVFDQRGDITIDYLVALNREGVAYYTNSDDGAVCWMPLPELPKERER